MKRLTTVGALLLLASFSVRAAPAATGERLPAIWKAQDITFAYSGFTAKYSCQGLRDKLRDITMALGARKDDLKITTFHCGNDSSMPAPFPGANVHMSSVLLAMGDKPAQTTARWKTVDLQHAANLDRGDCELLDQVRQSLLPMFATRGALQVSEICTPNQLPTGTPKLELTVLMPDVAAH